MKNNNEAEGKGLEGEKQKNASAHACVGACERVRVWKRKKNLWL